MPIITDGLAPPPPGIPIVSTEVEMEEGKTIYYINNYFLIHVP